MLRYEVKQVIVKYAKNWPKDMNSLQLITLLDKFAAEIIEVNRIVEIANELENK